LWIKYVLPLGIGLILVLGVRDFFATLLR
jgi:hypothetical protein